jgi:hypothetical protein
MADLEGVPYYIPISRARVKDALFAKEGITDGQRVGLERVSEMMEAIWHHDAHSVQERLKTIYEHVDPDMHEEPDFSVVKDFLKSLDEVLVDGNWEEVTDQEMQDALEGEDVYPISLNVRFDEFQEMHLYKLGEHQFSDVRKRWFGMKKETIHVNAYDRILQVIQYKDKAWFESEKRLKHFPGEHAHGLHLHLFKTVPKLDLETIFPNTTPNMRLLDKIKVAVPLVGGLVTLWVKFGPLLFGDQPGETSLAFIMGAFAAFGTYMVKAYLSYRKTKEKYLAKVSQDLYFKGQANNSAVLNLITDIGEEQEVKEALLAYAFLLVESDKKYDMGALDDRIEEWISDTFDVIVDFEVDDALDKLERFNLLKKDGDGVLTVVPVEVALETMDDYWDNIYTYAN